MKRETRVSCGAAALPGTRRVLARQGWAGEKAAFLSILQTSFPVEPDMGSIEVSRAKIVFPQPANRSLSTTLENLKIALSPDPTPLQLLPLATREVLSLRLRSGSGFGLWGLQLQVRLGHHRDS